MPFDSLPEAQAQSAALTPQEAFNIAAPAMLAQGRRSMLLGSIEAQSACAYRSPDALKCAIGQLIPDADYRPEMEGRGVGFMRKCCPSLQALPLLFLANLQVVHDQEPVELWKSSLQAFGLKFGLSLEALESVPWSLG